MTTSPPKVHLSISNGRAACNTRLPALTTRERGQVSCGLCMRLGVNASRQPVQPRVTPPSGDAHAMFGVPLAMLGQGSDLARR